MPNARASLLLQSRAALPGPPSHSRPTEPRICLQGDCMPRLVGALQQRYWPMAPPPMHCMWPHSAVHPREQSRAMALPPCSMRQFLVRKGCAGCRAGLWRPTRRACAGHCLLRAVHGPRERAPRPAEQDWFHNVRSGTRMAFLCVRMYSTQFAWACPPRVAEADRTMISSKSCPGLHASHPGY